MKSRKVRTRKATRGMRKTTIVMTLAMIETLTGRVLDRERSQKVRSEAMVKSWALLHNPNNSQSCKVSQSWKMP
jgi:hypothetical protein